MARENEQLRRAVESRDIIGQAKGMLMERFDVDAAGAFGLLVKLSQESNTRLAHVAQKLVELDHPSI
jgi:AmiR/NasT family two-component response regulator